MTAKAADPQRGTTAIGELTDRVGYTHIEMPTPGDGTERGHGICVLARVHGRHTAAIADQFHMPEPIRDAMTAVSGGSTSVRNVRLSAA